MCTVIPEGEVGRHGVKLNFWNFNFWLAVIETSDYVGHGTVFIFFQLQKLGSPEPSKVGQIRPFWHFHLNMAKICHQNIKLKHVPEKHFHETFFVYEYLPKLLWKKFCENHFSGTFCKFIFRWILFAILSINVKICKFDQLWKALVG